MTTPPPLFSLKLRDHGDKDKIWEKRLKAIGVSSLLGSATPTGISDSPSLQTISIEPLLAYSQIMITRFLAYFLNFLVIAIDTMNVSIENSVKAQKDVVRS